MDTEIDWAAEAERLLADIELYPDIIPVLPRDLVGPDVDYGCAGYLPDFHVPKLHEPNVADIQGVAGPQTAVNLSWGRLWPSCDAKNHLVTARAPVSGARFPVHAGIAPLVIEGLRRQELGIGGPAYVLDPKQCGGFNCRPISGTNSPSNHSGGLAIDEDWTWNPFKKGAKYKMPEWVWRMWEWLGFYWGGRYSDFMHIEYLQSPAAARARIAELNGPVSAYPTLRLGDVNPSVEVLRRMLRLPIHNRFDQEAENAIKGFQARKGLDPDGVCGPMTWAALLADPPRSGDENVAIIQVPATPAPADINSDPATWPRVEVPISLGYVGGWSGKCIVRHAIGHPGGYLFRAHCDFARGDRTDIQDFVIPEAGQSHRLDPVYKQKKEYAFAINDGPGALLLDLACPGGASVSVEFEK